MTTTINHKIYGITEDIKQTQSMIQLYQGGGDPADSIMEQQFLIRKSNLFRELLSELILSGISIAPIKDLIQQLTNYIENTENQLKTTKSETYDLKEVRQLLSI